MSHGPAFNIDDQHAIVVRVDLPPCWLGDGAASVAGSVCSIMLARAVEKALCCAGIPARVTFAGHFGHNWLLVRPQSYDEIPNALLVVEAELDELFLGRFAAMAWYDRREQVYRTILASPRCPDVQSALDWPSIAGQMERQLEQMKAAVASVAANT